MVCLTFIFRIDDDDAGLACFQYLDDLLCDHIAVKIITVIDDEHDDVILFYLWYGDLLILDRPVQSRRIDQGISPPLISGDLMCFRDVVH